MPTMRTVKHMHAVYQAYMLSTIRVMSTMHVDLMPDANSVYAVFPNFQHSKIFQTFSTASRKTHLIAIRLGGGYIVLDGPGYGCPLGMYQAHDMVAQL